MKLELLVGGARERAAEAPAAGCQRADRRQDVTGVAQWQQRAPSTRSSHHRIAFANAEGPGEETSTGRRGLPRRPRRYSPRPQVRAVPTCRRRATLATSTQHFQPSIKELGRLRYELLETIETKTFLLLFFISHFCMFQQSYNN